MNIGTLLDTGLTSIHMSFSFTISNHWMLCDSISMTNPFRSKKHRTSMKFHNSKSLQRERSNYKHDIAVSFLHLLEILDEIRQQLQNFFLKNLNFDVSQVSG